MTTLPTDLLDIRPVQGVTVVRFLNRTLLDPLSIETAGDTLAAALRAERPLILLDFTRVESVASAMIGRLLAFNQAVERAGGKLAFCGVGPFLSRIFALCHVPDSIGTHADETAGVTALQS